ncbi:LLM class flavin-dependent oxidoreductase [Streptomyces sp. NPDC018026]|uniref:LLM class flavin-dependent oxidoreductase n=1 Tax=Streptomyces sp. NPDC018026 TaxID=3365031 RepID=UPI003797E203
MRHGIVILPDESWSEAARRWRRAEQLGFDHAWTFDHLMWRGLREHTWFSAMPTLTAAAGITHRIRLGTLVANPNLRHPLTFAKEIMTLDDISEGRVVCGIGAGAPGWDAEVFGAAPLPPGQRHTRFAEFTELTDLLLRRRETDYSGVHYTARGAYMAPGCRQRPGVPIAVAAAGPRSMRLAARVAASWITVGLPELGRAARFDEAEGLLRDQAGRLDEACEAEGRDPRSLGRMVVAGPQMGGVLASRDSFEAARGMFEDLGFTDMVVFWPRGDEPFRGREDLLDEIAPLLGAATDTVPNPGSRPDQDVPAAGGHR